jgi:hypothetical protein
MESYLSPTVETADNMEQGLKIKVIFISPKLKTWAVLCDRNLVFLCYELPE